MNGSSSPSAAAAAQVPSVLEPLSAHRRPIASASPIGVGGGVLERSPRSSRRVPRRWSCGAAVRRAAPPEVTVLTTSCRPRHDAADDIRAARYRRPPVVTLWPALSSSSRRTGPSPSPSPDAARAGRRAAADASGTGAPGSAAPSPRSIARIGSPAAGRRRDRTPSLRLRRTRPARSGRSARCRLAGVPGCAGAARRRRLGRGGQASRVRRQRGPALRRGCIDGGAIGREPDDGGRLGDEVDDGVGALDGGAGAEARDRDRGGGRDGLRPARQRRRIERGDARRPLRGGAGVDRRDRRRVDVEAAAQERRQRQQRGDARADRPATRGGSSRSAPARCA